MRTLSSPPFLISVFLVFVFVGFVALDQSKDRSGAKDRQHQENPYFKRSRDLQDEATDGECAIFEVNNEISIRIVASHSGKNLAVDSDSMTEGATIVQSPDDWAITSDLWYLIGGLQGGYYHIVNRHSGLPMSVFNGSDALRADIIQSGSSSHLSDNWCFIEKKDTQDGTLYYNIVNQHSGYLLDVAGGSTTDGVNVLQWKDTGSTHQQFQLKSVPYASPTAAPTDSPAPSPSPSNMPTETSAPSPGPTPNPSQSVGPSAGPTSYPTETGAPSPSPTPNPSIAATALPSNVVTSESPSGSPSFAYVNSTASPTFVTTISSPVNETSPSTSPTESPAPSPAPSAGPTLLPSDEPSVFQPTVPSSSMTPSSIPSVIPSVATASPSTSSSPSVDMNCAVMNTTTPYHIIASHSGLSLAVDNLSIEAGSLVVQMTTDYIGNGDDWSLESSSESGFYNIINQRSSLAMAVEENSMENGAPIIQLPVNSALSNDNWCFQEVDVDLYQIVAQSSGLVIDIVASSENIGVNLHQFEAVGAPNQRFALVPVTSVPTAAPSNSFSPTMTMMPTVVPRLVFRSSDNVVIKENAQFVVRVQAEVTTMSLLPITYSIAGGVDASLFTINNETGSLFFQTSPDFETPNGATNSSNIYHVDVQISHPDLDAEKQSISVTVTDVSPACPDGPLPVFLLLGQSNMVGLGSLVHLEELVFKSPELASKYGHLGNQTAYEWMERPDVYIKWTKPPVQEGKLRAGLGAAEGAHFGPELEMGFVLGDHLCDCQKPILLLKAADGGRDLAIDWRSPLSGEGAEATAPGYPFGWYYDTAMASVKASLTDEALSALIPSYNPSAGYELLGAAWFHGWADMLRWHAVNEYESNLVDLIKSVRLELDAPDLPFVVGEMGMHGLNTTNERVLAIREAQRRAAESFNGTAAFATTAQYAVHEGRVYDNEIHYHGRADTIFDIGHAFGEAMVGLLNRPEDDYC